MHLDLDMCDDEQLKSYITYRLSSTKSKTKLMQERLKDIMQVV